MHAHSHPLTQHLPGQAGEVASFGTMAVMRASSTHAEENKAPKDRSMKMLSAIDLGTAVVDLAGWV
jgi:hypothetical protein